MSTSDNLRARGHFLHYRRKILEKEFKTIHEQISILKYRNLTINNDKIAHSILTDNNYYYLINGYKNLFIDNNCKK